MLPLLTAACQDETPPEEVANYPTYRPLYAEEEGDKTEIRSINEARRIRQAGKIYYQDYGVQEYVLVTEPNAGVHVYNNTDPQNPRQEVFIRIRGVEDVAIKDKLMIANNFNDLVTIDISRLDSVHEVHRIEDYREAQEVTNVNQDHPPQENVRFVCPDPKKGLVVGWEKATVDNAECYR
jgi:hypothetical protein